MLRFFPRGRNYSHKLERLTPKKSPTPEQISRAISSPLEDFHKLDRIKQSHARTYAQHGRTSGTGFRTYFDFTCGSIVIVPSDAPYSEKEKLEDQKLMALKEYLDRPENIWLYGRDS